MPGTLPHARCEVAGIGLAGSTGLPAGRTVGELSMRRGLPGWLGSRLDLSGGMHVMFKWCRAGSGGRWWWWWRGGRRWFWCWWIALIVRVIWTRTGRPQLHRLLLQRGLDGSVDYALDFGGDHWSAVLDARPFGRARWSLRFYCNGLQLRCFPWCLFLFNCALQIFRESSALNILAPLRWN